MPDLMTTKMRREGIRFFVRHDQGADGIRESACDEQQDGFHTELVINGNDQKDNDPTHRQKANIRNQDGDSCKENGLKRDE